MTRKATKWSRPLIGEAFCVIQRPESLGSKHSLEALYLGANTMTTVSDAGSQQGGVAPLRAKCGWIVALGVVYLIAGLIALSSVALATVASVFVVGIMMLIAGVAEVINAFQFKSWGKFLLWIALGIMYVIAGVLTFRNPLLAAAVLTLFLGAVLVASGLMRLFLAFSMKEGSPWIWVVLVRRDHDSAGRDHPLALAGFEPLHSGNLSRHRPCVRGDRLDLRRPGPEKPRIARRNSRRALLRCHRCGALENSDLKLAR